MDRPQFTVTDLQRDRSAGGIFFTTMFDQTYFSEVSMTEGVCEQSSEFTPPVATTGNYIREWSLSEPFVADSSRTLGQIDYILAGSSHLQQASADVDGLLDLSRYFDDMERTVLLRKDTVLPADTTLTLAFDYLSRFKVYLNGQLIYQAATDYTAIIGALVVESSD